MSTGPGQGPINRQPREGPLAEARTAELAQTESFGCPTGKMDSHFCDDTWTH